MNLAPADLRKEGAAFDLPIAIGILAAEGIIPLEILQHFVMVGTTDGWRFIGGASITSITHRRHAKLNARA